MHSHKLVAVGLVIGLAVAGAASALAASAASAMAGTFDAAKAEKRPPLAKLELR